MRNMKKVLTSLVPHAGFIYRPYFLTRGLFIKRIWISWNLNHYMNKQIKLKHWPCTKADKKSWLIITNPNVDSSGKLGILKLWLSSLIRLLITCISLSSYISKSFNRWFSLFKSLSYDLLCYQFFSTRKLTYLMIKTRYVIQPIFQISYFFLY